MEFRTFYNNNGADEIGLFKALRVHKDSQGRLFVYKKQDRYYLTDSDIHHVKFFTHQQFNAHLTKHVKFPKIQLKLLPEKKPDYNIVHEFRPIEFFRKKHQNQIVYASIHDQDKNKKMRENKKAEINKDVKHSDFAYEGKLGVIYCLINKKKLIASENERRLVEDFSKVVVTRHEVIEETQSEQDKEEEVDTEEEVDDEEEVDEEEEYNEDSSEDSEYEYFIIKRHKSSYRDRKQY